MLCHCLNEINDISSRPTSLSKCFILKKSAMLIRLGDSNGHVRKAQLLYVWLNSSAYNVIVCALTTASIVIETVLDVPEFPGRVLIERPCFRKRSYHRFSGLCVVQFTTRGRRYCTPTTDPVARPWSMGIATAPSVTCFISMIGYGSVNYGSSRLAFCFSMYYSRKVTRRLSKVPDGPSMSALPTWPRSKYLKLRRRAGGVVRNREKELDSRCARIQRLVSRESVKKRKER